MFFGCAGTKSPEVAVAGALQQAVHDTWLCMEAYDRCTPCAFQADPPSNQLVLLLAQAKRPPQADGLMKRLSEYSTTVDLLPDVIKTHSNGPSCSIAKLGGGMWLTVDLSRSPPCCHARWCVLLKLGRLNEKEQSSSRKAKASTPSSVFAWLCTVRGQAANTCCRIVCWKIWFDEDLGGRQMFHHQAGWQHDG